VPSVTLPPASTSRTAPPRRRFVVLFGQILFLRRLFFLSHVHALRTIPGTNEFAADLERSCAELISPQARTLRRTHDSSSTDAL
jgi:hypothetical protein